MLDFCHCFVVNVLEACGNRRGLGTLALFIRSTYTQGQELAKLEQYYYTQRCMRCCTFQTTHAVAKRASG